MRAICGRTVLRSIPAFFITTALLLGFVGSFLFGQGPRRTIGVPINTSNSNTEDSSGLPDPQSAGVADLMAKRRIKLEEKEHDEDLERARETAQLSTELYETFQKSKALAPEDLKKLERIEKLTKKIRDHAGGTEGELEIADVPHDMQSALQRLDKLSGELRNRMEKTSRMEVSAAVIDRANQLLELIKIVRSLRASNS